MTRTLVIDAETTGIPARGELVSSPSYPHLVQFAGLLIDEEGLERASFNFIVHPIEWEIPRDSTEVHGVSQELALSTGVPLRLVVATLTNLLRKADEIAGHNLEFDLGIVRAAMLRVGAPLDFRFPAMVCTADLGTDIVRMPATQRMIAAGYGKNYKRPKLSELHEFLFGESFADAHSALADCRACARCLLELRRRADDR